jgi:hypothetical protein
MSRGERVPSMKRLGVYGLARQFELGGKSLLKTFQTGFRRP